MWCACVCRHVCMWSLVCTGVCMHIGACTCRDLILWGRVSQSNSKLVGVTSLGSGLLWQSALSVSLGWNYMHGSIAHLAFTWALGICTPALVLVCQVPVLTTGPSPYSSVEEFLFSTLTISWVLCLTSFWKYSCWDIVYITVLCFRQLNPVCLEEEERKFM